MDVIGGAHVIQHTEAKTFSGFKEPAEPCKSVLHKFQQKLPPVAAMSQMPSVQPNNADAPERCPGFKGFIFRVEK